MRKIVLLLAVFCLFVTNAYASSSDLMTNENIIEIQRRIELIGVNILNSNRIEQRAVFDFSTEKAKNAYSRHSDRQIVLYRGLYNRLNNDDEIAAILAHEIAHSVESYQGAFKGYFTIIPHTFAPRKYEYKADKRSVDYLVKAGYNPVAVIVVLSKVSAQERYEWCSSHPLTSRRMMEVYEYIYKKYPEYLVHNSYKNDPFYQNFLLTSRENREKFQKKIESGSKSSVKYK